MDDIENAALAYSVPLIAEILIQLGSYTYDLVLYGRITSLHAYSAKVWGFTLYLASAGLLAFHSGSLIWLCLAAGLVSFLDALAIKLTLPGWQHDIHSFVHARRIRAGLPQGRSDMIMPRTGRA